jgi:hypothetical protein
MSSVGAKGAESGGKERQIRRPFHPDVQFLRILTIEGGLLHHSPMTALELRPRNREGAILHGCRLDRRGLMVGPKIWSMPLRRRPGAENRDALFETNESGRGVNRLATDLPIARA